MVPFSSFERPKANGVMSKYCLTIDYNVPTRQSKTN